MQLDLTLVNDHHAGLRRYRALSVCNLVLILFIGSSHQAHCKWWHLCCTFTPRLLDAYRLRQKRRIPALCVTYFYLRKCWWKNDLPKCRIGKFYTAWASIGGGRGGRVPPTFQLEGVSIGNVLTLFLVHTTHLKAYIARLLTPFSYKFYIGLVVKLINIIRVQI